MTDSFVTLALLPFVLAGVMLYWMTLRLRMAKREREEIKKAWAHVLSQANPTLKIVEADKVLDEALHVLGFRGTLGEKLKMAAPRFSDIDAVWRAHKLRNTLVHELQKTPSDNDVSKAIAAFEKGLRDLGMR